MGHDLMDKVMLQWGDLPGHAFKALLLIAASARDDDPRPVYWGGWERLAIVGLGRRDWPADDDDSPEAELLRKGHWEAVRRAMVKARKAGAISVKTRGKPGHRAEFWVHLDRADTHKVCIQTHALYAENSTKRVSDTRKVCPQITTTPNKNPGGEPTSSPEAPHQAPASPVDNPKSRHLQAVRDRADAERKARAL